MKTESLNSCRQRRWPDYGVPARTNPAWTTTSSAGLCVTTTTRCVMSCNDVFLPWKWTGIYYIHNIISFIKYEEFLVMQNTCISFIHCQEKYNYPTARIPLQNILVSLDWDFISRRVLNVKVWKPLHYSVPHIWLRNVEHLNWIHVNMYVFDMTWLLSVFSH